MTMQMEIKRRSPVKFDLPPAREEKRGQWTVVLAYENQGDGPHLVDLSHCPRWDLQSGGIDRFRPLGVPIPERPGRCALKNGVMINRMNNSQAAVWHLTGAEAEMPSEAAYTDMTDATAFLALIGEKTFAVTEKLTDLDLSDPARITPRLVQGPLAHVPCQIVVMATRDTSPGILLTCSRGYGHDMITAILEAGAPLGLRPAGESAFLKWFEQLKFPA